MVNEIADELIQNCISATREGADFPTVWQTVLRRHSLVVGPPIQGVEGGRVCLKIPLITNQWLVFDSTSNEFSLLSPIVARSRNVGHANFRRRPTDVGGSRPSTQPTAKIPSRRKDQP